MLLAEPRCATNASMQYWLMKSEPGDYSIDDLERDGTEHWDGIRNYQARNLMRDQMEIGDRVLFYHSNAKPPGVVGVAEIASGPYPDHTQFDPKSKYHDPKSDPDNPRWIMVDVKVVEKLPRMVSLPELREYPELAEMVLLNRSRLSVQPVTREQYEFILDRAQEPAPTSD
jgi:predicted RNA-binding protein with PUA-like domain